MRGGLIVAAVAALPSLALPFTLTSPTVKDGETIPKAHTCDGADSSPALTWTKVPANTKAFAVVVEDPDAPSGTFSHWVLYDLPGDAKGIVANVPKEQNLASGVWQGENDFGRMGWGGPCPPPGKPHRYVIKVYALRQPTGLAPRARRSDLLEAIKGHILGEATLQARYGR